MENNCIKSTFPANFFPNNAIQQIYPFASPLMHYILSHASFPIQIKISQACKDLHQKLNKLHNFQVDQLWMTNSQSYYRIKNGKVHLYPTTKFLLQLQHPFIVTESLILFNITHEKVEQVLTKINYSSVEKVYLSCCILDFEIFKKILLIPRLKLISYWSSSIINTGKIDIEDYIGDNFPGVFIHEPD